MPFIVLEGPDGAGTTTHCALLADALKAKGHEVLLTAEPTDGPIGKFIREQLKQKTIPSPEALQLLFCADRAWHVETVIKPALKAGKIVICDRYVTSTLLYGEALGINAEWLASLNANFLKPDIELFTLPPLDICLQRMGKREVKDVFEKEEFTKRVHGLYVRFSKDHKEIITIDTSGERHIVAGEIRSAVETRL